MRWRYGYLPRPSGVHILMNKLAKIESPAFADEVNAGENQALGGGLEGAQRTSRETVNWSPPQLISPDALINPVKDMADARAQDLLQNDGYVTGALHTNRDSIVGAQYMVNSTPNIDVLQQLVATSKDAWVRKIRFTEKWIETFQAVVEARFNLLGDSPSNWLDASRRNTLTDMIRLGIASHLITGEICASAEWIRQASRPCNTAIQMINPVRLCNPNMASDTATMRKGVVSDMWGQPVSYWIRNGYPYDPFNMTENYKWQNVLAEKPWGRKQFIHIVEQFLIDQTRGVSEMVAAMKQMRMTRKFQDITLQNAVVNATYAAAIETELPKDMIWQTMGGGQNEFAANGIGDFMSGLAQYMAASKNIHLDGVKVPVLYPGTKFQTKTLGTPGGVGTSFEESLHRNVAAAFGLSYEQYSRDFSKTNYSSARASMGETQKRMNSKKKVIADRFATDIYYLWLEEEINAGMLPLPDDCTAEEFAAFFYLPLAKEALCSCSWIGASRGQIDELKETQAAILRINAGLSTREKESARLGDDWRATMRQLKREKVLADDLGLDFSAQAAKPGANDAAQTITKSGSDDEQDNKE